MFTEQQCRDLISKINSNLELLGLKPAGFDKLSFPYEYRTIICLDCSRKVAKLIEALIPFLNDSDAYVQCDYINGLKISLFT